MQYEIVRMPEREDSVRSFLESIGVFLDAMYPKEEEAIHGDLYFAMDYFLYLWDNGGLFILVGRSDNGTISSVAICSQYRDLWSGRPRVEIQRYAMTDSLDELSEIDNMVKYLKNISGLLKFNQIYKLEYYEDGTVVKRLVWNEK